MPVLGRVDAVQVDSLAADFKVVAIDRRGRAGDLGEGDGGYQRKRKSEGS